MLIGMSGFQLCQGNMLAKNWGAARLGHVGQP